MGVSHFDINVQKELFASADIWHIKWDHFWQFWPISVSAVVVVVLLILAKDVVY